MLWPWRRPKDLLMSCKDQRTLSHVHAVLLASGAISGDPHVTGHLIAGYARLGDLAASEAVFETTHEPSIAAWNALLIAFSRRGSHHRVLALYHRMLASGNHRSAASPDSSTFTVALSACARLLDVKTGEEIKVRASEMGYGDDVFVCSSVLNFYVKCGRMQDALKLFDEMPRRDLVSYSTMVSGLTSAGRPLEAIDIYFRMRNAGMNGDCVMMVGVIQSCTALGDWRAGLSVHGYLIRCAWKSDLVIETALVDLYAKSGLLKQAKFVFEEMQSKNVVSWSALIAGYSHNGFSGDAFANLVKMQDSGVQPDLVALVSALVASSHEGLLRVGKSVHAFITRRFEFDRVSGTAAIDMYSKCGSLSGARSVFDMIGSRDLITWNAMIASYGAHGLGKEALSLFLGMKESGWRPDHATFASLLSAFSHSGLVFEGRYWFDLMGSEFGIKQEEKHYVCMVDLLSRAGHVDEALKVIKSMPDEPGIAVWVSLLSGCHHHSKIELGEYVAGRVLELDPEDQGVLSLVSSVYAAVRKWDKVVQVRRKMKALGMKEPGYSLVEQDGVFHVFLVDGKSHPQLEGIVGILEVIDYDMRISWLPS